MIPSIKKKSKVNKIFVFLRLRLDRAFAVTAETEGDSDISIIDNSWVIKPPYKSLFLPDF